MPSLISGCKTSTVNRLADQQISAIRSIVVRSPSVKTFTPHIPNTNEVTISSAAAGLPAYSQLIFNVHGEQ